MKTIVLVCAICTILISCTKKNDHKVMTSADSLSVLKEKIKILQIKTFATAKIDFQMMYVEYCRKGISQGYMRKVDSLQRTSPKQRMVSAYKLLPIYLKDLQSYRSKIDTNDVSSLSKLSTDELTTLEVSGSVIKLGYIDYSTAKNYYMIMLPNQ